MRKLTPLQSRGVFFIVNMSEKVSGFLQLENYVKQTRDLLNPDCIHKNGNGSRPHDALLPPSMLIDIWVFKNISNGSKEQTIQSNRKINESLLPEFDLRMFNNRKGAEVKVRALQERARKLRGRR